MKIRAITIAACTAMVLAFWTTQGSAADTEASDLTETYAVLIDKTIAKCLRKGKHLDSRSPNLRRAAIISCLKAGYLKAHRQDLCVYLVDVRAVPSAAIVQYHLYKNFYKTFRPSEMYALLDANQIQSNLHASRYPGGGSR